ncbi:nucleoside deaminase [Patescibacteria group bacterium]|nr:nucleoside deaminase [Patescibacteria group bacterium]
MNEFMNLAVEEAQNGIRNNHGGPFGVVIVRNGEVIARNHNRVLETNDPTAHAEVNAIRDATKKLGTFDLSDCEIYSTCEPCPMCLGAVHWAKMKKMVYGCTQADAAAIDFDDQFIYDVIRGTAKEPQVEMMQADREECLKPFREWEEKTDKVQY